MKFNYIYGKQAEQYDYLYIPKAFMKEEPFKTMTASAKIMYAVLMEKQQKSVEMGWIDEKNHVYNMSKTNPILSINLTPEDGIDEMKGYSEIIKENIDYDSLLLAHPYDQEMVEGIYDLILETVLSKNEEITIAGDVYPKNLVKSKFLKLNYSHVEYVINCLGKNTTKVRNIKSYLLASLFNAGSTISSYYKAEVNHDMPQFAG